MAAIIQNIGVRRAAQIVDHLPAGDRGHSRLGAEQIGQKLPVAPRPAMMAGNIDIVACRIVFHHFDITDERGTGIAALEQIVAQNGVFTDLAIERRFEKVDVIKSFAREGSFTKYVLIDIGNRKNIRVDAAVHRKDALQEGGVVARRE